MNVARKLKEAETYYSMGMLDESLAVYQAMLSDNKSLEPENSKFIEEKAESIRLEIQNKENNHNLQLSNRELSLIKNTIASKDENTGDIKELLDSATAFKELGLLEAAAAEYEKALACDLTNSKTSPADILMCMAECLLEFEKSKTVIEKTDKQITKLKLSPKEAANIKFVLGKSFEKKDRQAHALALYREANKTDPDNNEISERLKKALSGISSDSKFSYLLNEKLVTENQLQQAVAMSKKSQKSIESVLVDHFKVPKDQLGQSLSLFYNCPYKAFDNELPIPYELITNLKKSFLVNYAWVPLSWSKAGVEVLVDDPNDLRKTDHIKALMSTPKIQFSVGIREDIIKYIELFFKPANEKAPVDNGFDALDNIIPDITFEEEEEPEEDQEIVDESSSQVVKFVDQVLITAYRKNVSDIHIEPSVVTKTTGIRFRMDGVCQEYIQVPNIMAPGIISRLKILSNLDIAERRLPQDGKIKMKRKGIPEFELRISTMPTAGGLEDAVLRILAKAGAMALDDMGMNERNVSILKNIIVQPYGLILVVGPTGSGKTTTLHSALGHINKPEIKIWTAEDPVEITQPGLRQVEVKARIGLDFARVMRGFLRLDPDVIMIGEMRDQETAATGVEASLTGHLVFSTLHTNSAPETVTRLLDMGLNPLNFSDAFLGVLAQRLVRRLCTGCKKPYHPSEEVFQEYVQDYGAEEFAHTGIEYGEELELQGKSGCDKCSNSGYKGRMGIHELMEGTKPIKELIKRAAPTEELFKQAFEDGMTTLKQDGIVKMFQGFTDMDEIRRVCAD